MSETMIDYKGIGLAAPQVHISKQIIIFRMIEDQKKKVMKSKSPLLLILELLKPQKKQIINGKDAYPYLEC